MVETIRVTAPDLIDDVSSFLGDAILIFVMGAYWITSRQRAEDFLVELVPVARQAQVRAIMQEIEFGLGAYVRGLALISLIVGVLCFLALALLRVPNAATLAFIYGITTAVPIIGGLIGVVLCTSLALLSSPAAQVCSRYVAAIRRPAPGKEASYRRHLLKYGAGVAVAGAVAAVLWEMEGRAEQRRYYQVAGVTPGMPMPRDWYVEQQSVLMGKIACPPVPRPADGKQTAAEFDPAEEITFDAATVERALEATERTGPTSPSDRE